MIKTIDYACPTSDHAKKLGFYEEGCFYLASYEEGEETIHYGAETLKDLETMYSNAPVAGTWDIDFNWWKNRWLKK